MQFMADLKVLLNPFGQSIFAKSAALREIALTTSQRSRLRESISDDIKKCSNFVIPEVSQAAFDVAHSMGIDLREKCWHDQHSFDRGRAVFHFEHVLPVSAIREACLGARTADETTEILSEKLRVAWILKEEDRVLTEKGFRVRRTNPDEAYIASEIVLRAKNK